MSSLRLDVPILEIDDLTVCYGSRVALSGVSLAVAPGQRVAIVGPNGSGKSTLLKAIVGLVDATSGRIAVHDHLPGVDRCVAYVPQRAGLDWAFPVSVGDVVLMGRAHRIGWLRRPAAADRTAMRAALAAVDIADLEDRRIRDLSGGQQQRMLIAQALAQEAKLVLMDEPLNNLDAASAGTILDVLDGLADRGVAVLVAMHDLALAEARFDRALLLARRMVAYGPPREALSEAHLRDAYGAGLQVIDGPDGRRVLSDPGCCDDGHAAVIAALGGRRVVTGIAADAVATAEADRAAVRRRLQGQRRD